MNESPSPARAAAAEWDAELAALPDHDAWIAAAVEDITAADLVQNGRLVVRVARPRLLDESDCARDQAVVDAVGAALVAAGRLVLAEPTLGERYIAGWLADSPALFDAPSGYPQEIVLGRFDGVRDPAGLQVIEFNGGLPGGAMPTDASARVMRTWSPFASLAARHTVRAPEIAPEIIRGVQATWESFGGSGSPYVVVVVPAELQPYLQASLDHIMRVAADLDVETRIADPGDLRHGRDGLTLAGRRVDVVFRVFFTSMVAALGTRLDALFDAVRAGDVCMITSMRAGLFGHKALFAVVTDPDVALDVPDAVRATALAHLPWTRVVGAGRTLAPDGERVDLAEYALAHRERLVLKPVDGFGGSGVRLGWESTPEEWAAALEASAGGGWIVQSRLGIPTEEFPELAPGFPQRSFTVDHNPVVVNGRIAGYFARLAASGGITNMASGAGSVAPTFLLS